MHIHQQLNLLIQHTIERPPPPSSLSLWKEMTSAVDDLRKHLTALEEPKILEPVQQAPLYHPPASMIRALEERIQRLEERKATHLAALQESTERLLTARREALTKLISLYSLQPSPYSPYDLQLLHHTLPQVLAPSNPASSLQNCSSDAIIELDHFIRLAARYLDQPLPPGSRDDVKFGQIRTAVDNTGELISTLLRNVEVVNMALERNGIGSVPRRRSSPLGALVARLDQLTPKSSLVTTNPIKIDDFFVLSSAVT